jgi:hypothetical protein
VDQLVVVVNSRLHLSPSLILESEWLLENRVGVAATRLAAAVVVQEKLARLEALSTHYAQVVPAEVEYNLALVAPESSAPVQEATFILEQAAEVEAITRVVLPGWVVEARAQPGLPSVGMQVELEQAVAVQILLKEEMAHQELFG